MTRPNIVFFFTDDQRFDTIRALGNERIQTPNIDRLVDRGAAFTHAHIPCGTSGAICMPSRAMLHTGRSLFHIEGAGERIPPEHPTLGETFRNNGYRTFGTGKWHNGREAYARSFSDGAEIMFGGMADHWNVPMYDFDPAGAYDAVRPMIHDPWYDNAIDNRPCDHVHAGRHSSEIVCDAAVDFIAGYDAAAPFFAYVSFLAPHDPRSMPQRFLDMYDPDSIELPPNFLPEHPFDNGSLHVRDEELAPHPRSAEDVRRHTAEYYAMITHLDDELGRVVQALQDKGVLDETIIVLAGDNGLAVGRHGLFGKQNCYDHSVRVPLVFAGPGVPAGQQSDAYVYHFDIFPTLCELAGVATPATVEGSSLVDAMNNPAAPGRANLYFAYEGDQRAVKDRQFKLIEYVVDQRHVMTQLFDLAADPWELTNLAEQPDHAPTLARMRQEMAVLRDSWGDLDTRWGQEFWPAINP